MNIFVRAGVLLLIVVAMALPAVGEAPKTTPTPTPEPRLTGGFGKTPAPPPKRAGPKKGLKITNESLVTEPDKGKVSTSDVKPAPTPTARATSPRSTTPGSDEAAEAAQEGEEYWRAETRRLRERVAALQETITRLDYEAKKFEADFYSWDDGAYRDRVIKPAWDKAREELVTARRELPVAEKDLADLPDRARRAGVPPGWLRE
jgi:hypothetical protein